MLGFLRRSRVLVASALFLLVAAVLVLRTSAGRVQSDRVGRLLLDVVAPFQRGAAAVTQTVVGVGREVTTLLRAPQELAALRLRVAELEQETTRLAEAELENVRLRELMALRERLVGDLAAARVIGRDAGGKAHTMVVDRGDADGVVAGAAVLAPAGIVGHVFRTGRHAARVLLIVDHNSGVDAVVQRTRARGILEGRVDGGCGLKFVKRTEDVQVGDRVVTSGLDGIFPKGLPIGEVVAVDKRGQGLFQYAEVAPAVDFDRLEEVLVSLGTVEPVEPDAPPAEE
jgi:rod shape-determining protein MreC